MREWRILCDKCGEEIKGNPIILTADRTARANPGEILENICEGTELCDACWGGISDAIRTNFPLVARTEPDQEGEASEKESKKRTKIDHGKVRALYEAGWKYKDIADEMGYSVAQVNNSLQKSKTKKEETRSVAPAQ